MEILNKHLKTIARTLKFRHKLIFEMEDDFKHGIKLPPKNLKEDKLSVLLWPSQSKGSQSNKTFVCIASLRFFCNKGLLVEV